MNPIRVLIVDDQQLMREGLRTILDLESDLVVTGTAANGLEAVQACQADPPDIVLMDIRMPELDGVAATHRITTDCPGVRVIILTTFDDDELIIGGLRAGASTYLLKDLPADKLIDTIRATHRGDIVLQPGVAARLIDRAAGPGPRSHQAPVSEPLTPRELETLRLMAEGMSNGDIAARLYLSEGTVKNHVSSLYGKIGLNDRTQAVLFALKHGLITLDT